MAKFLRSVEVIVMTDIQRAMLGDHEAAARLTEQGVLIPCPCCKSRAIVVEGTYQAPGKYSVTCGECFFATPWCVYKDDAIERWNTRAPILSAEEMEMLEGME